MRQVRMAVAVAALLGLGIVPARAAGQLAAGLDGAAPGAQAAVGQELAVAGEIVDPTGQRIAGATVILETASGRRLETTTDARGEFRFGAVPAGTHRVTAVAIGFAPASSSIEVAASDQPRLSLALPVLGITSQITVTAPRAHAYDAPRAAAATRLNVPILDTPVSVQVVPRQVFDDQAVRGLEDVYTNVSGVTQSGNTLNAQTEVRPMIRGFETAVPLRNGLRATTVGAVDPVNIESVEVLKGPASILYGALEPGGVLNYVTKKPLMAPQYEVTQQAGSHQLLRTTLDATGPLNGGRTAAYRVNAAFEDADSFRDGLSLRRVAVVPSFTFRPNEATELFTDVSFSRETVPYDSGVPFGFDGRPLVEPQDSDFSRFRTNIPDIAVTGNSLGYVPPAVQRQEVILATNRWPRSTRRTRLARSPRAGSSFSSACATTRVLARAPVTACRKSRRRAAV